jgi:hypothetical protein
VLFVSFVVNLTVFSASRTLALSPKPERGTTKLTKCTKGKAKEKPDDAGMQ